MKAVYVGPGSVRTQESFTSLNLSPFLQTLIPLINFRPRPFWARLLQPAGLALPPFPAFGTTPPPTHHGAYGFRCHGARRSRQSVRRLQALPCGAAGPGGGDVTAGPAGLPWASRQLRVSALSPHRWRDPAARGARSRRGFWKPSGGCGRYRAAWVAAPRPRCIVCAAAAHPARPPAL